MDRPPARSCRAALRLTLLVGSAGLAAGQDAGAIDASRSFAPAGWEVGDCPASYGADAVLCAGTDTGPFKVDRHIPTVWVRGPGGSCAEAEKGVIDRPGVKLTVTRRTSGRCGPGGAPCTELRFKDSRPVDPIGQLVYVVCPAGKPVQVVLYGVSARVIDAFEPVARAQARWQPGS
ncbi:MAG TPA: hypothetical protein VLQ79_05750 [Myxococcaceae bacterium]|nr:hypothetical protein [Myxococcaceae bacterium]